MGLPLTFFGRQFRFPNFGDSDFIVRNYQHYNFSYNHYLVGNKCPWPLPSQVRQEFIWRY